MKLLSTILSILACSIILTCCMQNTVYDIKVKLNKKIVDGNYWKNVIIDSSTLGLVYAATPNRSYTEDSKIGEVRFGLSSKELYTGAGLINRMIHKNGIIYFSQISYTDSGRINTINTSTTTIDSIQTPLELIRYFSIFGSTIVAEGNSKGSGRIYISKNSGKTWKEVNTLKKGFKSVFLLSEENGNILCRASKTFNDYGDLFLFDVENNQFIKLHELSRNEFYLKPISTDAEHLILDDTQGYVFDVVGNDSKKSKFFSLPGKSSEIGQVYMKADTLFASGRSERPDRDHRVWGSFDFGKSWQNMAQSDITELISNPFGGLFLMDENSNVYSATIDTTAN